MKRMKKNKTFLLDVYSTPTIDIVGAKFTKGGPPFYASLALHAIGATYRIILNIPDNVESSLALIEYLNPTSKKPIKVDNHTLIFKIDVQNDERKIKLLGKEYKSIVVSQESSFALFSPLLWEYTTSDMLKVINSHGCTLIDIQGFSRLKLEDSEVINTFEAALSVLSSIVLSSSSCVIAKFSLEDFANNIEAATTATRILVRRGIRVVLTMGSAGLVAADNGVCLGIEPLLKSGYSVGAGDILATLILYAIYSGMEFTEALLAATSATSCILTLLEKHGVVARASCAKYFKERIAASKRFLFSNCCLENVAASLSNKR
jgi:sugar/nucleoside kinase (ribokinase family)